MRGRVALFFGLLGLLNAQPVLAGENSSSEMMVFPEGLLELGKCITPKLRDGTKIELADRAVDEAVRGCKEQFLGAMGLTNAGPVARASMIAEMESHPEHLRGMALTSISIFYGRQQHSNAGGHPAVSTPRSK